MPQLTKKAFQKYGFSTAVAADRLGCDRRRRAGAFTRPERLKWPQCRRPMIFAAMEDAGQGGTAIGGDTGPAGRGGAERSTVQYQMHARSIDRINAYFGYCARWRSVRLHPGCQWIRARAAPTKRPGDRCADRAQILPAQPGRSRHRQRLQRRWPGSEKVCRASYTGQIEMPFSSAKATCELVATDGIQHGNAVFGALQLARRTAGCGSAHMPMEPVLFEPVQFVSAELRKSADRRQFVDRQPPAVAAAALLIDNACTGTKSRINEVPIDKLMAAG